MGNPILVMNILSWMKNELKRAKRCYSSPLPSVEKGGKATYSWCNMYMQDVCYRY
jgi:hypothetical protein